MPPRHELNERFQGHLRRAQRARAASTAFLATLTVLVVVGSAAFAFQDIAPNMFARATSAPKHLASQFAAASSLPWLDTFADALYRTVCPLFRDCQREAPEPQQASQLQPAVRAIPATTLASSSPRTSAPVAVPQTIVQQPVIERIRETVRTATEPGANAAYVDARIAALAQSLQSQIDAVAANASNSDTQIVQTVGMVGRIDNLSGTTITNPTITGGSITAASITGTISNAISSALATISDLTSTTITATHATFTNSTTTNATTTNLSTTNLAVTGSGTSTFASGVSATRLALSAMDCSSLGNGGTLTTDEPSIPEPANDNQPSDPLPATGTE